MQFSTIVSPVVALLAGLGSVYAAGSRYSDPNLNHIFPQSTSPKKFEIKVDQEFLDLTKRKVHDYRPTFGVSDDWGMEGPPAKNITAVAEYWDTSYDWDKVQSAINANHEHYAVIVSGSGAYELDIPLHFIHHRSARSNATPLLLLHGWPSSNLEWSKVIQPLLETQNCSFHIVAPDLPGFGFSPAPKMPGLGPREMGKAFDALMKKLGYEKYGIVTTDLGWLTGMWMTYDVHDSIIGHMSDFVIVKPTAVDYARLEAGIIRDDEKAYIEAYDEWFTKHWTYATVHGSKPLTLSLALGDSPVGLLGWYWDVNYATSDGYPYSFDELITGAMMLWIPGPYANIRAYLEFFKPEMMNFPATDVPTGISEWSFGEGPFPKIANFAFAPRDWVERVVNLKYFKQHDKGGHFPAIAQPDLWAKDVQRFFSTIVKASKKDVKDEL